MCSISKYLGYNKKMSRVNSKYIFILIGLAILAYLHFSGRLRGLEVCHYDGVVEGAEIHCHPDHPKGTFDGHMHN